MTTKQQTTAAQAATYETHLVEQLKPHPKNIRAEVVPSDELVASVRRNGILQALVVAPHPTLEGDYTVIAGHHRLAAAKKAGLDRVPVCVRHDLLTDELQVAAMVQENAHRKDLTVVEEANAFQTLLSFDGWDAKRVAAETGVSQRKVRDRVKLARLGDEARQQLAAGQVSLERAMALAEFAGEPEEEELVQMLGTHESNWDWHLRRAKESREWRARIPALRVELGAAGIEVLDEDPDAGKPYYERGWETADVDGLVEAVAAGAQAVLDPRYKGGVRYIVRKQTPERTEKDAAAERAAAERRDREKALEADLDGVAAVERDWILHTVLPAAKAGDERVTRVAARHLAALLGSDPSWLELNRAGTLLGLDIDHSTPRPKQAEALAAVLAGRSLAEVAVVQLVVKTRVSLTALSHWRWIAEEDASEAYRWFRLRQELGWDLTDPEKAALEYVRQEQA